MMEGWRRAMKIPNVRGLVAGRSLIFPADGEIERWVDDAVAIVHGARRLWQRLVKLHHPAGSLSTSDDCRGDRPGGGGVVLCGVASVRSRVPGRPVGCAWKASREP